MTSYAASKASEALWNGEDYKKSITASLKDITTHGKRLHLEAEKANFKENHETHTGVIDANNGIQQGTALLMKLYRSNLTFRSELKHSSSQ